MIGPGPCGHRGHDDFSQPLTLPTIFVFAVHFRQTLVNQLLHSTSNERIDRLLDQQQVVSRITGNRHQAVVFDRNTRVTKGLSDCLGDLKLAEFFTGQAREMRTLVEERQLRTGADKAIAADDIVDVVAIQTAECRHQKIVFLPLLKFVCFQHNRTGRSLLGDRNKFKKVAFVIQQPGTRLILHG